MCSSSIVGSAVNTNGKTKTQSAYGCGAVAETAVFVSRQMFFNIFSWSVDPRHWCRGKVTTTISFSELVRTLTGTHTSHHPGSAEHIKTNTSRHPDSAKKEKMAQLEKSTKTCKLTSNIFWANKLALRQLWNIPSLMQWKGFQGEIEEARVYL